MLSSKLKKIFSALELVAKFRVAPRSDNLKFGIEGFEGELLRSSRQFGFMIEVERITKRNWSLPFPVPRI